MFKLPRSQPSVRIPYHVSASEATSEGRGDLLVSGMKLRSKNHLDGDGARSAEARAANVTPPDPFEKEEQTLI